jgi:Asp-tRNA(Asn)/Glu-tRNA(Gln) amidotransferase A subunit family amidase
MTGPQAHDGRPASPRSRPDPGPRRFVLIPGSGGAATWYWQRVVPLLRDAGHEAVPVDLPGADPAAGLPEYARLAAAAIGGIPTRRWLPTRWAPSPRRTAGNRVELRPAALAAGVTSSSAKFRFDGPAPELAGFAGHTARRCRLAI